MAAAPAADKRPLSAPLAAARAGNAEAMALWDGNLAAERDDEGRTALHHAVAAQSFACARVALDRRVDPNAASASGVTALHVCARLGNVELARMLLERGAEAGPVDKQGRAPIHVAIVSDHVAMAACLVKFGKVSARDMGKDGWNCMHFAAMRGSIDAAQWALGEGCAVDEVTADGLRPLHIAAARGHAAMVRWLVRARGADPVAPDARGSTPLHLGVSGPSDDVIVTLLLAGGEALASDHNGLTPLALAARRRTPQQLQQLQQQGAGPASPAATPLRPDIAEGRTLDDVSAKELYGGPEVWVTNGLEGCEDAPEPGSVAMAVWLLEESIGPPRGPNEAPHAAAIGTDWVDVRWAMEACSPTGNGAAKFQLQWAPAWGLVGWTTLGMEVPKVSRGGASFTLHVADLPAHGTFVFRVRACASNGKWGKWSAKSAEVATTGAHGEAAAGGAAAGGTAAGGTAAAGRGGGEAGGGGGSGESALPEQGVRAARRGDVLVLRGLEQSGVSLASAVDAEGRSALHHAASAGQLAALQYVFRRMSAAGAGGSAALERRDAVGATPLLLACVHGQVQAVAELAELGASIETADAKGFSALHYAARKGSEAVFRFLVEAGASTQVRTSKGVTVEATVRAHAPQLLPLLARASAPPPAPPAPPLRVDSTARSLVCECAVPQGAAGVGPVLEVEVEAVSMDTLFPVPVTARTALPGHVHRRVAATVTGAVPSPPPVRVHVTALDPSTPYALRSRVRNRGGWSPFTEATPSVRTRARDDPHAVADAVLAQHRFYRAQDRAPLPALLASATATATGAGAPAATASREDGGLPLGPAALLALAPELALEVLRARDALLLGAAEVAGRMSAAETDAEAAQSAASLANVLGVEASDAATSTSLELVWRSSVLIDSREGARGRLLLWRVLEQSLFSCDIEGVAWTLGLLPGDVRPPTPADVRAAAALFLPPADAPATTTAAPPLAPSSSVVATASATATWSFSPFAVSRADAASAKAFTAHELQAVEAALAAHPSSSSPTSASASASASWRDASNARALAAQRGRERRALRALRLFATYTRLADRRGRDPVWCSFLVPRRSSAAAELWAAAALVALSVERPSDDVFEEAEIDERLGRRELDEPDSPSAPGARGGALQGRVDGRRSLGERMALVVALAQESVVGGGFEAAAAATTTPGPSESEGEVWALRIRALMEQCKARDGATALHAAAMANNPVLVRAASALLRPTAPPRDHRGWTPWHWAAAADADRAIFDLATRARPPMVFTADHTSRTPLHAACAAGASLGLRASLALMTDAQERRRLCCAVDVDGHTPLHIACARGDAACAILLLAACVIPGTVPVSAPRALSERDEGRSGGGVRDFGGDDDGDVDLLGPASSAAAGAGASAVPLHVRVEWDRLSVPATVHEALERELEGTVPAAEDGGGGGGDGVGEHEPWSVQNVLQVRDAQDRTPVAIAVAAGNEALLHVLAVVCRPPAAPPTPFLVDRGPDELVWRWWFGEVADAATARTALQSLEDREAAAAPASASAASPHTPRSARSAGAAAGAAGNSLPRTHLLDLDAAQAGLRAATPLAPADVQLHHGAHPLLSLPLGDLLQTWLAPRQAAFEVLVDVFDRDAHASHTASVLVYPFASPPAVVLALPQDRSLAALNAAVDQRVALPPGMPPACTLALRGLLPSQSAAIRVRAKNDRGWGPFSPATDAVAVSSD